MRKRTAKIVLSAAVVSAALAVSNPTDVYAAENNNVVAVTVEENGVSVTEVSAVMWSNENTALLASPDDAAVAVPNVAAGLPINVTGVTSNGYFRIDIGGQVFYVNGTGLSAGDVAAVPVAPAVTESSAGWTQEKVYNAIMALQSKYPEGMPWSEETNGKVCGTFVSEVWEDIFGFVRLNSNRHEWKEFDARSVSEIKVGDIVRQWPKNGGTHVVVVLTVGDDYITVVEGNYNGTVHWGRKITEKELRTGYDYDDNGNVVSYDIDYISAESFY